MGTKDPEFNEPAAAARLMAERLGGGAARVELIDGAGHCPQAEVPQETTAAVLAFLDDLRRTRAGTAGARGCGWPGRLPRAAPAPGPTRTGRRYAVREDYPLRQARAAPPRAV